MPEELPAHWVLLNSSLWVGPGGPQCELFQLSKCEAQSQVGAG